MNDFTLSDTVKVGFGVILMAVWVGMVAMAIPHSEDIVAFCKLGLTGLAAHYLTGYTTPPPAGATVITTTATAPQVLVTAPAVAPVATPLQDPSR